MMIYHNEELQLLDESSGETRANIQLFDSNFVISLLLLKLAFVGGEKTGSVLVVVHFKISTF